MRRDSTWICPSWDTTELRTNTSRWLGDGRLNRGEQTLTPAVQVLRRRPLCLCVTGLPSSFPGKGEQPRVFPSQEVGFSPIRRRPGEGCSPHMALHVQLHLSQPPARCRSCCYMYGAIRTHRKQLRCDGLLCCVAYLLKDPLDEVTDRRLPLGGLDTGLISSGLMSC